MSTMSVVRLSAVRVAVSGLFALSLTAASAGADSYSFSTVDPPYGEPGVDLVVQIAWINNTGAVTVQYQDPPDPDFLTNMHTALRQGGEWTNLDVPQAITTGATNPSNSGQVVLSYRLENDPVWRAAYSDRRGLKPIPSFPGYPLGTVVQGVNDHGQIAAVVTDADGNFHGLFGTARSYAVVDYPGAVFTQANMINNQGVGIGIYSPADGSFHAFKWDDGVLSNIDPPSSLSASAIGINNAGTIVGVYINADGALLGYVQCGDEIVDFAVPGATLTFPYSINDRGQIAGVYNDADGVSHGFVATPDRSGSK